MGNKINLEGKNEKELCEKNSKNTGESFGNLYIYKKIKTYIPTEAEKDKMPKSLYEIFLHDGGTGNFHMMPDDFGLAELCSAYIFKKGTDIWNCIKENELYQNKNINKKRGKFQHAKTFRGTDFESRQYLFSYIRVAYNNTTYDLVFNRFFFDENNKVNCILLCPQIEICDESLNELKKRNNPPQTQEKSPKIKNYPKTSDNNQESDENQGDSVYYNFGIDLINSTSKEIADAFLKFVIKAEKEKARKAKEANNA